MNDRVLFVDDDQMLLASIQRCLGLKFNIETALSGPEALKRIEEGEPYAVVLTDMRMPVMDGVEFLGRAREISPHSIYLMLTGNQDLATATRAVNEGSVFQFLNKPCDPDDIGRAIEQAFRQYELDRCERELFQGTQDGALAITGELIHTLRPEWTRRIARADQVMDRLRADMGLDPEDDYRLAARLAPLGFALMPSGEGEALAASTPGSTEHTETMIRAFDQSAKMISHLPRFEGVAEIVRLAPQSEGAFVVDGNDGLSDFVRQGAALLRAAYLIDALLESGVNGAEAEDRIVAAMPGVTDSFRQAIAHAFPDGDVAEGVSIGVDALRPGMVLARDLRAADGQRLMSAGRKLGAAHIARLRGEQGGVAFDGEVEVTRESYEEAGDDAAEANLVGAAE